MSEIQTFCAFCNSRRSIPERVLPLIKDAMKFPGDKKIEIIFKNSREESNKYIYVNLGEVDERTEFVFIYEDEFENASSFICHLHFEGNTRRVKSITFLSKPGTKRNCYNIFINSPTKIMIGELNLYQVCGFELKNIIVHNCTWIPNENIKQYKEFIFNHLKFFNNLSVLHERFDDDSSLELGLWFLNNVKEYDIEKALEVIIARYSTEIRNLKPAYVRSRRRAKGKNRTN